MADVFSPMILDPASAAAGDFYICICVYVYVWERGGKGGGASFASLFAHMPVCLRMCVYAFGTGFAPSSRCLFDTKLALSIAKHYFK